MFVRLVLIALLLTATSLNGMVAQWCDALACADEATTETGSCCPSGEEPAGEEPDCCKAVEFSTAGWLKPHDLERWQAVPVRTCLLAVLPGPHEIISGVAVERPRPSADPPLKAASRRALIQVRLL